MKSLGFTLAETLITLGIIGVVAAITIPGFLNNYKAKKLKSQFLKSYSVLQQVFKQAENDDISLAPDTYGRGQFCTQIIPKYLSGTIVCGNNNNSPCYNTTNGKPYKTLSKANVNTIYLDDGQVLMKDGTLLMCELSGNQLQTWISVDINGYTSPPNIWGYDLFTFQFADGELIPMGSPKTLYYGDYFCNKTSNNIGNGLGCAYKALNNTDYFKNIVKIIK